MVWNRRSPPSSVETMKTGMHTDRQYDEQLGNIRNKVSLMGGHVAAVVASAAEAMRLRDVELAQRTIARDDTLDRLEREIDESCMVLLATRAPMGSDLRFVTTAMKIAVELERAGDLAVGVCERVIALPDGERLTDPEETAETTRLVLSMLRDGLEAFTNSDPAKARAVLASEPVVDERFAQIFDEMLELMAQDTRRIPVGAQVQSVAKRFERMADHATNIAQLVLEMLGETSHR
jgi:phosphate transport system protein